MHKHVVVTYQQTVSFVLSKTCENLEPLSESILQQRVYFMHTSELKELKRIKPFFPISNRFAAIFMLHKRS